MDCKLLKLLAEMTCSEEEVKEVKLVCVAIFMKSD